MKLPTLMHPLRDFARVIVGGESKSGDELNALYTELADRFPAAAPEKGEIADAALSLAIGAGEGAGLALQKFVLDEVDRSEPKPGKVANAIATVPLGRAAHRSVTYKVKKSTALGKEGGKFLALAGVLRPPDPEATKKLIAQVVTLAKANKERVELEHRHAIAFPKLDDFADMSRALIGINQGEDEIDEVRVVAWGGPKREVEIHAFDKAGFHVLSVGVKMHEPGVLYIHELQASHGRNCDELFMAFGGASVPGRGNSGLISAGLEALIVEGAKGGLYAIATNAGSPQVQHLYEKMGFTSPGQTKPWRRKLLQWIGEQLPVYSGLINLFELSRQGVLNMRGDDGETMQLDLTDPKAVKQALVGFQLARASFKDVPKNVAARMKAQGVKAEKPKIKTYRREIPDANNTRIIRAEEGDESP